MPFNKYLLQYKYIVITSSRLLKVIMILITIFTSQVSKISLKVSLSTKL